MFEDIKFNGTFRSYQQKVLDGAEEYLSDGKINIVAAPGSGKTILGLELIRRLGKPCLILSPTTTIREQWGERFIQSFSGDEDMQGLVSFDLKAPKAITSITYQALYSAAAKVKCQTDDEEVDNSSVDIFKFIEECGIGTLCLDEAHHLQNEWQKALENFIAGTGKKCAVISLTATPPYDAAPAEWKRYTDVCGEIDEEIFVPELVKSGTLCPHQDYIYICYPNESDCAALNGFYERTEGAVKELKTCAAVASVNKNLTYGYAETCGWLDDRYEAVACVLWLIKKFGFEPDARLFKLLNVANREFGAKEAERALEFIISEEKLLFESERKEIVEILQKYGLIERGKVTVDKTDKLKKTLAASTGKLSGIAEIASEEFNGLGEKLRLLVLTDFIKRGDMNLIGTDRQFDGISVVSVFETIRRSCAMPVGALSGGLVILPAECAKTLDSMGAKFNFKPLADGSYCEFTFSGGNREKVNYVGKLFEKGEINAIVGTKSLLGEGWDSPCVNALILASFVGSFMLSNQMRGRAIRVDKNNPDKTANIWHLITAEPSDMVRLNAFESQHKGKNELNSSDFETLERRFCCFVAPDYSDGKIKSGIGRITAVKPPYDKAGCRHINKEMILRSRNRNLLKYDWENSLVVSDGMKRVTEVPSDRKFSAFTLYDFGLSVMLVLLLMAGGALLFIGLMTALKLFDFIDNVELAEGLIASGAVTIFIMWALFVILFDKAVFKHFSSEKSVDCICESLLQTFKDLKLLPETCTLNVHYDEKQYISVELANAPLRAQKLFKNALGELYSPIGNPRYVILPRKKFGYNYKGALACPEVFGSKREYAETLAKNLKKSVGNVEMVYTRSENGKSVLRKCRFNAYIYNSSADVEEVYESM